MPLTRAFRETIRELKERDYAEYRHVYLGEPKSDEESAVIRRSWLMACIDSHTALKIEALRRHHRAARDNANQRDHRRPRADERHASGTSTPSGRMNCGGGSG